MLVNIPVHLLQEWGCKKGVLSSCPFAAAFVTVFPCSSVLHVILRGHMVDDVVVFEEVHTLHLREKRPYRNVLQCVFYSCFYSSSEAECIFRGSGTLEHSV